MENINYDNIKICKNCNKIKYIINKTDILNKNDICEHLNALCLYCVYKKIKKKKKKKLLFNCDFCKEYQIFYKNMIKIALNLEYERNKNLNDFIEDLFNRLNTYDKEIKI